MKAMVIVSMETQAILDQAETEGSKIKENPLFIAGIKYAEFRFNAEAEVLSWNKPAVDELIFNLLIAEKISVTDVIGLYTATIKKASKEKQELISALATKLMMYRKKWHSKAELPEFEKTVDEILKHTGLWRQK